MRPAGRFCANGPEPFGNCPARDRFRKSQAAEASPDIPAAYPQKRQSERSMNSQMSEGLQLKSPGFLSKAARAEARCKNVKIRGRRTRHGCGSLDILPS